MYGCHGRLFEEAAEVLHQVADKLPAPGTIVESNKWFLKHCVGVHSLFIFNAIVHLEVKILCCTHVCCSDLMLYNILYPM